MQKEIHKQYVYLSYIS